MRPYEVMIIFDAALDEDTIRGVLDRCAELLQGRGATPGPVDRWGKRRFAYELNHRWEGYYVLLEANAEPAVMADLDRMLTLADEVIRHKIMRLAEGRLAEGQQAARSGGRARPGAPPPAPADVAPAGVAAVASEGS